jgi:hypothetical protein
MMCVGVERCGLCQEPTDGTHRIEVLEDGRELLMCPSFKEFVLDGREVIDSPLAPLESPASGGLSGIEGG